MTGTPRILDNGLDLSAVDELAEQLAPSFHDAGLKVAIPQHSHTESLAESNTPAAECATENPQACQKVPTLASAVKVTAPSKRDARRNRTSKQAQASRGLFALAAQRWRLIATAITVLISAGLGVRGWQQKSATDSHAEQMGLDFADFSEDFSINSSARLGTAGSDSSDPPKVVWDGIADREPRPLKLGVPPPELPTGGVYPVGHSVVAADRSTGSHSSSPGTKGLRGAWLTGQIEVESDRVSFVDPAPRLTTTHRGR